MEDKGEVFEVVVVGAGIMGSCTAYEAARRGARVLLLEQFDLLHHLGSSHGESRTIRATYPEPHYPAMVLESAKLWEQAQSEAGYRVYTKTPHLDIGPADDAGLRSAIKNCKVESIQIQVLDQARVCEMFAGAIRLPESWVAAVSEIGGVIKPTKAVAMFQTLALKRGAVLRDRMKVKEIKRDGEIGGIRVLTASGDEFRGKKCVVTAGAWTKKLLKKVGGLELPIQPLHTTVCYWRIKEGWEAKLSPEGGFPSFASYGDPYIYGTPSLEFPGLIKIALHGGHECDPDRRDWGLSTVEKVRSWIEQVMPECVEAAEGPMMKQACMYSMTPDEDYVIDFVGGEFGKDVVVGGGFSGHGFKMGPLVGRILADLALEGVAAGVELAHFRLGRFGGNSGANVMASADQDLL